MKYVAIVLIFGLAVFRADAQPGAQCKTAALTPRHFLNLPSFLGEWYVQKFSQGLLEDVHVPNYKCLSVTYGTVSGTNHLTADEAYLEFVDGALIPATATNDVVVEDLGLPAIWTMYSNITGTGEPLTTESVILHTDHHNWAIQYTCSIRNESRREALGVWTRSREIDSTLSKFLDAIVVGLGFPRTHDVLIDQTECDA